MKCIVDVSTNGVFVNQKKLQKHIPQHIKSGDIIAIKLSHSFADALVLEFLDVANPDSSNVNEIEAPPEVINKEDIEPMIKCPICHQKMLEPVAVYPCIHSFCGHCFAKYHLPSNDDECPTCSLVFVGFQWNHKLRKVIDKISEPCSRTESELQEAGELRSRLQKAIDLKVNSESAVSSPIHHSISVNTMAYSCRACSCKPSEVTNFKCPGLGSPHAKCSMCHEGMPDLRQTFTFCAFCGKDFCSFLWPCHASQPSSRFNKLRDFVPLAFPPDWQHIDPIENLAFKNYIARQLWKPADFYRHCFARLERGDFNWDASSFATHSATIDSYACDSCIMNVVFPELGMFYRLSLTPCDLICVEMPHVRPYCPNGRECFMLTDPRHRKDFNHWCPPGMILV
ncbi:hypothetical protein DSO57_1035314 [Entomophthora muscae]|nr:hypothetical protein DSO57_1035314 [Entomophthora muscae]